MDSIENRTVYIYGLIDPRTNDLRYVGKSDNPQRRLRVHMSKRCLIPETHKTHWLRDLKAAGLLPTVQILAETDEQGWSEAEREQIRYWRNQGAPLTNCTDGGEGAFGRPMSAHCRALISASRKGNQTTKGRVRPAHEREAISKRRKGVPLSPEHRAKIAAGGTGRHPTEQTRLKLSLSKKGIPKTPEHIEKMRQASTGRTHTAETKQKLSLLWLGKKRSLEQRQNQSARQSGSGAVMAKLNEAQALEILQRFRAGERAVALAQEFGVCAATVYNIRARKTWKLIE